MGSPAVNIGVPLLAFPALETDWEFFELPFDREDDCAFSTLLTNGSLDDTSLSNSLAACDSSEDIEDVETGAEHPQIVNINAINTQITFFIIINSPISNSVSGDDRVNGFQYLFYTYYI